MKRYQSLSNSLFLGLSFLLPISCSDDSDADKKKELPALPTQPVSPVSQPRTGSNNPSPTPPAAALNSPESSGFLKSIAGTWLDSCKPTDQGSNLFAYAFEGATWTTYIFKYSTPDCSGPSLQPDGGARAYKLSLKQDPSGWFVASGSCLSDANGCKGEKITALRLLGEQLETKSLKPGAVFSASDSSPTYTYRKGKLSELSSGSSAQPAETPMVQPAAPTSLSPAAKRFIKLVQGTWIPEECIPDNRNPDQSLKYVVMFADSAFKTDIYRYKNTSCEGAPEIKPDGAWSFTYQLSEVVGSSWFALDAVKTGDPSNKTQRLFNLDGNVLRQYRLKKTETFAALSSSLETLKTDNLEKSL